MDPIRSGPRGDARDLLRSPRRSATFADLLAAARDGQPWAIDDLADRYLPRLTSFAAARGATDPQGIADVVLLSVLGRLDKLDFEVPAQFWAYLCLAARSRVIDEHRGAKPVELVADAAALEGFGTGPRPVRPASDFDEVVVERDYVSGLLSPLTDEQRQVLELRFLDDLSVEETASRTGRSPGAIKGLQRRAINAIIAAVAVALVVLALRGLADRRSEGLSNDPAGQDGSPPTQADDGVRSGAPDRSDGGGDTDGSDSSDGSEQGAELPLTVEGASGNAEATGGGPTGAVGAGEPTGEVGTAGTASAEDRHTITVGTARSATLSVTAPPGSVSESNHGVRIPCVASHVSHSDPILFPGRPGASPARVHWGNVAVDADAGSVDLTAFGNGTCEGGITDRSAYSMPALFDEDDQFVVPEAMLVEYKVFGGPGFDRATIRPIPAGLQLVAGPTVAGWLDLQRPPSGDGDSVRLHVVFPTCVAVDRAGQPRSSSPDHGSHLSYPSDDGRRSDGCPSTHPYRIPQLSFTLSYRVPLSSGWYLASGDGSSPGSRTPTGWAISAWDPAGMDGVVACLRDLRDGCWFGVDADGAGGRAQLPERFDGPDGRPVYDFDSALVATADPTPFGTSVTAAAPR